jgi:hypothetical protein
MISGSANHFPMSDCLTSVNRYAVKHDELDAFLELIDRHWATLRELELVTDKEPEVLVGPDRETGAPVVVELFEWSDAEATGRAHTHPAVSGVWEAMGPLCEEHGGRPPFEFLNLAKLER